MKTNEADVVAIDTTRRHKKILQYCFDLKKNGLIRIPIIADWHGGAHTSLERKIDAHCAWIKKENYPVIDLDDLIENSLAGSPGGPYDQLENPNSQYFRCKERCSGMNILAAATGNHSNRTSRVAGLTIKEIMLDALGKRGIYQGYTIAVRLLLQYGVGVKTINIVGQHGKGGGQTRGGKANLFTRLANKCPNADIYLLAHTHQCMTDKDTVELFPTKAGVMESHTRHFAMVGSLLSYWDSYADEGMMPPATPMQCIINIEGYKGHTGIKTKIWFEYI